MKTNYERPLKYDEIYPEYSRIKISITISQNLLERLDKLVAQRVYANRSQAIERIIIEKINGGERK